MKPAGSFTLYECDCGGRSSALTLPGPLPVLSCICGKQNHFVARNASPEAARAWDKSPYDVRVEMTPMTKRQKQRIQRDASQMFRLVISEQLHENAKLSAEAEILSRGTFPPTEPALNPVSMDAGGNIRGQDVKKG